MVKHNNCEVTLLVGGILNIYMFTVRKPERTRVSKKYN